MAGAQGPHQFEHPRRRHAGLEGALRGELVGEAVGERIGERHAQFEEIDPACQHRAAGRQRRVKVGVAGAQVGHKGRPAGVPGAGKSLGDAIHEAGTNVPSRRSKVQCKVGSSRWRRRPHPSFFPDRRDAGASPSLRPARRDPSSARIRPSPAGGRTGCSAPPGSGAPGRPGAER